ncbi:MAG: PucR family transcriptional regulator ligand-binding domain-containing protein [Oscillospiraceae bacterium]|nr:PucR family transcriptional regulator ligand-binding domain-containing protein [Oscillospiraceae bacterium]
MAIQLSRLFDSTKDLHQIQLRGGTAGLDNMVNWVHLLEDVSTVGWIRGSELVLTTGILSEGIDKEVWLLDLIDDLAANGACGLFVNVGKYIPTLPPKVIAHCDEIRFPLFTFPWEVHLVDIVRDFCVRIFDAEQSEESVTKAFHRAIFQPADRDAYVPFLEARGFGSEGYYRIFAVQEQGGAIANKEWAERFDTALRNKLNRVTKHYHIFRHEDMPVIIFPNMSAKEEAVEVSGALCRLFDEQFANKDLRIGIGPAVRDVGRLKKTYKRATLALRFAALRDEPFACFETMGLYRMLLSTDDTDLLREMLDENLGKLIRFDQKNGTDNMEILRLYIQNNFSVQQVGAQTFMHRNTINYRVRKIKEILGTDLESMDEKLKCLLAFYIYDML